LTLPANYKGFAYSTQNATATQNDEIWAWENSETVKGIVVLNTDANDPRIPSIRAAGITANTAYKAVKLYDPNLSGRPAVENITTTSADFKSDSHTINITGFLSGGFRYAYAAAGSEENLALGENIIRNVDWTNPGKSAEVTVETLEPNTQYYMDIKYGIKIGNYTLAHPYVSPAVAFSTKPLIVDKVDGDDVTYVKESTEDEDKLLVTAKFYESTVNEGANNVPITGVTVYRSATEIDATDLSDAAMAAAVSNAGATSSPLTKGASTGNFSDTGFSDFEVDALKDSATNELIDTHILIVLTNLAGDKASYALTYAATSSEPPAPQINVSVPTKLIFAAFESGEGAITAPDYHIINNGTTAIDVSITGLAAKKPEDTVDLALKDVSDEQLASNQFNLYFKGKVGSSGTISPTNKLYAGTDLNIGVCQSLGAAPADPSTDTSNTYYFTLAGKYNGSFAVTKEPVYNITFTFAVAEGGT
jgi:hypothetical protein